MSNYSVELRYLIENKYDLGMKEYPVISEEYRTKLNQKIVNHYYFHEIGFETAERFKFYLNVKLNEIMPYYNKLLQSELLEINPLLSFSKSMSTSKQSDTTNKNDTKSKNEINSLQQQEIEKVDKINNTQDIINSASGEIVNANERNNVRLNTQNSSQEVNETNSNHSDDKTKKIMSDTPQALLTDDNISNGTYASQAEINTNEKNDGNIKSNDTKTNSSINDTESSKESSTESNIQNNTQNVKSDTSNKQNETNSSTQSQDISGDISNKGEQHVNEINVITENGFEIPLSDLLIKYRETFLNVDLQIINELKELFMMVY